MLVCDFNGLYGIRFESVKADRAQRQREESMGVRRFFLIVKKPFKGLVDTFEMDKFKYGSVRSFEQYLDFSGVTFEEGRNDTNSCIGCHIRTQLKWKTCSIMDGNCIQRG